MVDAVSALVQHVPLPKMVRVRLVFERPKIEVGEIPGIINGLLEKDVFASKIKPGMSICVTAGSRGVANVALIPKTICDC
jgi:hypothetical protein